MYLNNNIFQEIYVVMCLLKIAFLTFFFLVLTVAVSGCKWMNDIQEQIVDFKVYSIIVILYHLFYNIFLDRKRRLSSRLYN